MVSHDLLLKVSDSLFVAECNNPEEGVVSQRTYRVHGNFNALFPGLQRVDAVSDNLPDLLAQKHSRITSLQESVVARACRREVELGERYFYQVLVAGLILWSDGLNPNTSTKDNRGSVWILLATLVLNWGKQNPGAYTYPLAVGSAVSICIDYIAWQRPFAGPSAY
jgi:hypothetical protein